MSSWKQALIVMQQELEATRTRVQEAIQSTKVESHDEIKQLRDTATALRDQMEKMSFDKQQAVQAAVAASSDEIAQLRQTIGALRDEMEGHRVRHGEVMQSARGSLPRRDPAA